MRSTLFRRLLPKPVANAGSELRDHQANERTFLSWTRMGLAFAAMALALGRLDIIDHIFHPQGSHDERPSQTAQFFATKARAGASHEQISQQNLPEQRSHPRTSDELVASRICQGISIWSFGYGLFRYVSVRQNLLHGRFVPAIWGPTLMTVGSLAVFGTTLRVDWRVPLCDLWRRSSGVAEKTGAN